MQLQIHCLGLDLHSIIFMRLNFRNGMKGPRDSLVIIIFGMSKLYRVMHKDNSILPCHALNCHVS